MCNGRSRSLVVIKISSRIANGMFSALNKLRCAYSRAGRFYSLITQVLLYK